MLSKQFLICRVTLLLVLLCNLLHLYGQDTAQCTYDQAGNRLTRSVIINDRNNLRGARYFDKKYGSGKEGYTYKNPDYFDIGSFERGGYSPYKNPRNNNYYQGIGNPISGSRFNIFDILSVFLM